MDEPAEVNETDFRASVLPIYDRDGAESRLALLKATYTIGGDGQLELAPAQHELRLGDELWGPPDVADIRLPGDFGLTKPGTDFVLSGHALPAAPGASLFADVGIHVADRAMTLRVHGPRRWRRGLLGVVPGPSEPLSPTPLAWSLAFGGLDLSRPDAPLEEARNPVGRGVARQVNRLVGLPAPQIESPAVPVGDAQSWTVPVGCAPLGRHFAPRRASAGTYDTQWLKKLHPGRPVDYREVHEQCAAPGLVFAEPLRGGEPVALSGLFAGQPGLAFVLPRRRVVIEADIDGRPKAVRPHLDTVVVNTDLMVIELVWRALFRLPKRGHFDAVRFQAKEYVA